MTKRMGSREVLIAFSLANLCFVRAWAMLIGTRNDYFLDGPASGLWVATVWGGVVVLACLFLIGNVLLRRGGGGTFSRRLRSVGFFAALAVAANGLRQQFQYLSVSQASAFFGRPLLVVSGVLMAGLLLYIARAKGVSTLARGAATGVLAMFPFFMVTSAHAVVGLWRSATPHAEYENWALSPLRHDRPSSYRVVVLVFDGLDAALPPGAKEFERLLSSSVSWENAYPRTNRTVEDLPSLITGRPITRARPVAANELMLASEDSETEFRWSTAENMFSAARRLGMNSALVGWYHPYCRVFGALSSCKWYPHVPRPRGMAEILRDQAVLLADSVPFAFRAGLVARLGQTRHIGAIPGSWHAAQYEKIHRDARAAIADRNFDLIFLHYPIPHYPFISRGQLEQESTSDYAGNVSLADQTLGELRQTLMSSGLSDQTVILVTSDHWHRKSSEFGRLIRPHFGEFEHRVPLIAHFPGQTTPQTITPPIQSAATYHLTLSLLDGRIRGLQDLAAAISSWPAWLRSDQGLTPADAESD